MIATITMVVGDVNFRKLNGLLVITKKQPWQFCKPCKICWKQPNKNYLEFHNKYSRRSILFLWMPKATYILSSLSSAFNLHGHYMATSMINYPTFCIFRFFESENLLSDTQERITARLRAELSVSVTYLSWQMMVKAKKVKLFGRKGLLILQQASHARPDLINWRKLLWRKLLKKKRKGGKKNLYSSIHKSACFHIFSQTLDCIIALL